MATIGELVFKVMFQADTMKLKDFSKAVGELNMSSIVSAGNLGLLYEGAKSLINLTDNVALGINKFGRETGQSREEIQKWDKMAEQMGVTTGSVEGSITSLVDGLYRMKRFGENSNIWGQLIDPTKTKDMFQVLTMLRERFKGMAVDEQRYYLQKLGLDTQLLNILDLSDGKWKEISAIWALSIEQLDKMDEHHQQMVKSQQALQRAYQDFGSTIAPISTAFDHWKTAVLEILTNSKIWKSTMEGIGYGIEEGLSKGNALTDIGKLIQASDPGNLYKLSPTMWDKNGNYNPMNALGPAVALHPPKTTVNIKNTIHTSDPHTTVDTDYATSLEDTYRQSAARSN